LKTCVEKYNARLLSIKGVNKQNFVKKWINSQNIDAHIWMDATRIGNIDDSSGFIWSNGDPLTYSNWDPTDPNSNKVGGNEFCTFLGSSTNNFAWYDYRCLDSNWNKWDIFAVCERPCCIS
jgi:Lectin C-type domain